MEVLITKAAPEAQEKVKKESLCLVSDMVTYLSGFTISYLEFSQGMISNKTLLREIYEPVFSSQAISNYDQLKEIASEQASSTLLAATQVKRAKAKKTKK